MTDTPLDARVSEILRAAEGSMVFDGLLSRLQDVSRDDLTACLERLVRHGYVHRQPLGSRGLYRWITEDIRAALGPTQETPGSVDARRRAVAEFMRQTPTPSYAEICRQLDISRTTLHRDIVFLTRTRQISKRPQRATRRPVVDEPLRERILQILRDRPGLNLTELAQVTNLTTDSLSPALSRLAALGLVMRVGNWRARWYVSVAGQEDQAAYLHLKLSTLNKLAEIVCPSIAQVLVAISDDLKQAGPREVA